MSTDIPTTPSPSSNPSSEPVEPVDLVPVTETDPAGPVTSAGSGGVVATGDPKRLTHTMLRMATGIGPSGATCAANGPGAAPDRAAAPGTAAGYAALGLVDEGPLVALAAVAGHLDELAAVVEGELRHDRTALAAAQARTTGSGSGELQELLEAQHGRRRTVLRLLARALAEAHGDLDEIGTQISDTWPDQLRAPARPAPRPAPVRGRAPATRVSAVGTVGAVPDPGVWARPVAELVPADLDRIAVGAVLVAGTHDLGVAAAAAWSLWSQRVPGRRLPAPVAGWCRRFRADPADPAGPVGAGAGHVWWPARPGTPGAVACVEFVLPTRPPRPDDLSSAAGDSTNGAGSAGGAGGVAGGGR